MSDPRVKDIGGTWRDQRGDKWGNVAQAVGASPDWKKATIAANETISSIVDLEGHFAYLLIKIPTIVSAQLELQVGMTAGDTFQDLGQGALTTAGTGAYNDTWLLGGWQFIKIKSSATQTSAVDFWVRGVTY